MTNLQRFEARLNYMNMSVTTTKEYLYKITYFLNNINMEVEDIKQIDVRAFLEEYSLTREPETTRIMISALRSFYKVMETYGSENVMVGIEKPRLKEKHKKGITKGQCLSLLLNTKDARDKAIISMLYNTGMRVSELSALTLEQYNNKDSEGRIKLYETKGTKARNIYLSERTINYVDNYLKVRKGNIDNLFVSPQGKEIKSKCLNVKLKRLAKKSSAFTEDQANKLSCHIFRHGTTTNLLNSGVPLQEVAKLMGHSNVKTTLGYWDANEENGKVAMSNII